MIRVYKTGDHFVVSDDGVWVPGAYQDEPTARLAPSFPNAVLRQLQVQANSRASAAVGVITFDDLNGASVLLR
jgi:hypothetical protein